MPKRSATFTENLHLPPASTAGAVIYTACVIARRFRNVVPTAEQLVEAFGMSRACAYRWRSAIALANGIDVPRAAPGQVAQPIPIPEHR